MPYRSKKYSLTFSDRVVATKAMDDLFKQKKVLSNTIKIWSKVLDDGVEWRIDWEERS